jgi:hypothetical protein
MITHSVKSSSIFLRDFKILIPEYYQLKIFKTASFKKIK